MSILDQVVGALAGKSQEGGSSGLLGAIAEMVAGKEGGGLGGLVQKFQAAGLGDIVSSWIGTSDNQPISSDQLHQALGSEQVQQLAARTGLPVEQVLSQLADHLPGIIDKLTPNGQVPEGGMLQAGLNLLRQKTGQA
jgi:uncharacterized protein YidB (DUF937 family)